MPEGRDRAFAQVYAESSPLLSLIPNIVEPSGVHKWNIQGTVVGLTGSRAEGVGYTAASGTRIPRAAGSKIYGGSITVDRVAATRSPEGVKEDKMSQAASLSRLLTIDFFHGVGGTTIGSSDLRGIDSWLTDPVFAGQKVSAGSTSAGDFLTMAKLDSAMNKLNRRGTQCMAMNGTIAIQLQTLLRASANYQQNQVFDAEKFGVAGVHGFNGMHVNNIPVLTLDDGNGAELLSTTETATGGSTSTAIYLLDLGGDGGIMGFSDNNGFKTYQVEAVGPVQTTEIEYVWGFAPKLARSFVKLYDIRNSMALS